MKTERHELTKEVYALYNPLNGCWLCYGQKGSNLPYSCDSLDAAKAMLKTILHYNETGEIKAF